MLRTIQRPDFRVAAGNPVLLEQVLTRHKKLRLFLENAGYPYRGEMIAMMTQYPQLYADVCVHDHVGDPTRGVPRLPRRARPSRARQATHVRVRSNAGPQKIGEGIEAIESATFLSEEQKRDILYHNAARFLRLEVEP